MEEGEGERTEAEERRTHRHNRKAGEHTTRTGTKKHTTDERGERQAGRAAAGRATNAKDERTDG